MTTPNIEFVAELEAIVKSRLAAADDSSYTAQLAASGTRRIAQKVGEEGVEVALAATSGKQQEIVEESADLVYHLLVLLADAGLSLADVVTCLKARHRP